MSSLENSRYKRKMYFVSYFSFFKDSSQGWSVNASTYRVALCNVKWMLKDIFYTSYGNLGVNLIPFAVNGIHIWTET